MEAIEIRARELLADAYRSAGHVQMAHEANHISDGLANLRERAALNAIIAALTPPEGYVLVPVQPTPKMVDATWAHCIDRDGGVESQNSRNKRVYAAMLSARPESP